VGSTSCPSSDRLSAAHCAALGGPAAVVSLLVVVLVEALERVVLDELELDELASPQPASAPMPSAPSAPARTKLRRLNLESSTAQHRRGPPPRPRRRRG
jgi:hypothetical protein